jgi:hypothetical protein
MGGVTRLVGLQPTHQPTKLPQQKEDLSQAIVESPALK